MATTELILLLALILAFATGCEHVADGTSGGSASSAPAAKEKLTIGSKTYNLELAVNDESRQYGLKGRQTVADDGGMIFIFPEPKVQSFWMEDCLVDIDIIFLDTQGRIVAMHKMKKAEPKRANETQEQYEARLPKYSSNQRAQFAIELQAGSLDKLNLKNGQKIEMDLARLKRLAR